MSDVDRTVGSAVVAGAVQGGGDGRCADAPAYGGGGIQTTRNALCGSWQEGFDGTQVGDVEVDFAAYGRIGDFVAELLADAQIGVDAAETGAAVKCAVDATVLETGTQGERAQTQRHLFFRVFVRQDDVAALAVDVEVAAGVLTVRQIPIAAEYQVVFDGDFDEVLQLGDVQALRAAFAGDAGLFVPNEVLQVEAAAHHAPARRAHGNTLRTCFEVHAVLQFEVERAADVERVHAALPLIEVFVQTACGVDFEFVGFAVQRHAAGAVYAVLRTRAAEGQVDRIDDGRAAGKGDVAAFDVGGKRTVDVGRAFEFEVKHADVDGFADTQGARFAGEVGFVGFQPAFEVA